LLLLEIVFLLINVFCYREGIIAMLRAVLAIFFVVSINVQGTLLKTRVGAWSLEEVVPGKMTAQGSLPCGGALQSSSRKLELPTIGVIGRSVRKNCAKGVVKNSVLRAVAAAASHSSGVEIDVSTVSGSYVSVPGLGKGLAGGDPKETAKMPLAAVIASYKPLTRPFSAVEIDFPASAQNPQEKLSKAGAALRKGKCLFSNKKLLRTNEGMWAWNW